MNTRKPMFWAVRAIGRPATVRITRDKVSSLSEACKDAFGTDTYSMEGKPLFGTVRELQNQSKRVAKLQDPNGWQQGRTAATAAAAPPAARRRKRPAAPRGKVWVVRVVAYGKEIEPPLCGIARDEIGTLVECLRYAGLLEIHQPESDGLWFDLLPPAFAKGNSKQWAENNAKRMQSFGFNAVSAPQWSRFGEEDNDGEA